MSASHPAARPPLDAYEDSDAARHLRRLMRERYTVANLKGVGAEEFARHIRGLPGRRDAAIERYADPSPQRDLSVQFEWGHNHDFGSFSMPGLMQDRHIHVLAAFMTLFGVPERDLAGRAVLDVGCWTGGTSLLLAALGARVLAIDEVVKYADCVGYLRRAFELENLEVQSRSLYSLDEPAFGDRFDLVLYSGVLYHVTDPVLSLRILFNSLRDGGLCLVETMAAEGPGSFCAYGERRETGSRDPARASTLLGGWAWFVPSLAALTNMLGDAGFRVRASRLIGGGRALAVAERVRHADMLRAGLSKPSVR
jgi:2-polyprenyl-3-methyl-5-hydroxy-6-metoxy-1,4-benzoquinol methylase